MNGFENYDEHQPITWIRGQPIYAAYAVVAAFVVSMLLTTILMFAGAGGFLATLGFSSTAVLRGEIWRVVTYGFVNQPRLWFVIDMFMIAMFGREIERFFGRRKFLWLYTGLYLLKPVLFTVLGFWIPTAFSGESGGFALFVAFATLYPNAMLLFNLLAKWVAVVLVAIYTLIALSQRDTVGLISLLATVGFAHTFVRFQQGHLTLPSFSLPRRQPKFRVLPDLKKNDAPTARSASTPSRPRDSSTAEMDALLDKIARSGMASLTADERARLDAAARLHKQRKYPGQ